MSHAHQVVGRASEGGHPVHFQPSAMSHLTYNFPFEGSANRPDLCPNKCAKKSGHYPHIFRHSRTNSAVSNPLSPPTSPACFPEHPATSPSPHTARLCPWPPTAGWTQSTIAILLQQIAAVAARRGGFSMRASGWNASRRESSPWDFPYHPAVDTLAPWTENSSRRPMLPAVCHPP